MFLSVALTLLLFWVNGNSQDLQPATSGKRIKENFDFNWQFHKGTALAYKANTLLYNEKWAEAATAAKAVMDLGAYGLFADYEGLFKEEN